jgi:hypothetical protein
MHNQTGEARGDSAVSRLLVVSIVTIMLAACAPTNVKQVDRLSTVEENPRILLMPPDIRYYLLTAGGVPEPNAEWTEAAQANFTATVTDYAAWLAQSSSRTSFT